MTTTTIPQTSTASMAPTGPAVPGSSQGSPAPAASDQRAYAVASFVLGIASIVAGWTFVAPIIGLVLGSIALKRGTTERALALWGVWLNGILLGLTALAALIGVAAVSIGLLALPFAL